jgi:hypothetical protein
MGRGKYNIHVSNCYWLTHYRFLIYFLIFMGSINILLNDIYAHFTLNIFTYYHTGIRNSISVFSFLCHTYSYLENNKLIKIFILRKTMWTEWWFIFLFIFLFLFLFFLLHTFTTLGLRRVVNYLSTFRNERQCEDPGTKKWPLLLLPL